MRDSFKQHFGTLSAIIDCNEDKDEIKRVLFEILNDIDLEFGWIDDRRKDAEEALGAILLDTEKNTKESVETDDSSFYVHSTSPLIFTYDNFITPEECQHVINNALPNLKTATVYNETVKADVVEDIRKCKVCYFKHDYDIVFSSLIERLSEITGIHHSHAEKFQVVSYEEGEYFDYHVDAFTPDESPLFLDGHQRIITTMVYLNDVLEGGETSFKMLNLNINPAEGRLLVFQNCKKNTNLPNTQTLHAGMPVKKGVKYVMNVWYRETVRSEYLEEIKNDKNYLSADV